MINHDGNDNDIAHQPNQILIMRKKITTLLLVCCVTFTYAQYTTLDFEPAGTGAGFTWAMFGNFPTADNTDLSGVANPSSIAPNTSATVKQFDVNGPITSGDPGASPQLWGGASTDGITQFTFDGTNSIIKIKVYKTITSEVRVKFEAAGGGGMTTELGVSNTLTNQWEELTFDFSTASPSPVSNGQTYGRLVIFPDFDAARVGNSTVYFDDFQIPAGNLVATPASAAPAPTHNEMTDNVLSVYSETYTTNIVSVSNFFPVWGPQTTSASEENLAAMGTNNALKYETFDYQGTEFTADTDISGRGYLHIDYWSATESDFRIWLIDSDVGDQGSYTQSVTASAWGSIDIPLFLYQQAGLDLTKVDQIKIDNGDGGTIYFDNIYFYGTWDAPTAAPSAPTHDETNDAVISIFSNAYTDVAGTNFNPGWGQQTQQSSVNYGGNDVLQYVNCNYQGTEFPAQDVSSNDGNDNYDYYLHFDYWASSTVNTPRISIIGGGAEHGIAFPSLTKGSWQSVDIPIADFIHNLTGNPAINTAAIIQLKVDDNTVNTTGPWGNIWLDNIYFYKGTPVAIPVELTSFSAKEAGAVNILKWTTESELNNSHFDIERSADGVNFEAIGQVEGYGTTFEKQRYSFTDETPNASSYYRLKQIDFGGKFEYSNIVNVNRRGVANDIKLFPNPTQANTVVNFLSDVDEEISIAITDITGRVLMTQLKNATQGANQFNLNLTQLPRGSYFVRLQFSSSTTVLPIIKQ